MKEQVLSIGQMKHLRELGVDTNGASMMYHFWVDKKYKNCFLLSADTATPYDSENVPTFTLQDMLEMLPLSITDRFYDEAFTQTAVLKILPYGDNKWAIKYVEQKRYWDVFETENLSDLLTCAYETLCWLAENNYIGGEKLFF